MSKDSAIVHDESKCSCIAGSPCPCPCEKCVAFTRKCIKLEAMADLEERLRRAGIDVDTFALLIWTRLEPILVKKALADLAKVEVEKVVKRLRVEWGP